MDAVYCSGMGSKKLTTRPGGVELRDGLPRYREDDVRFIVEELPNHSPCSVPEFCRKIGFNPRPGGVPSSVYARLLAAFQLGEEQGKLSQNGRNSWRVAVHEKVAKAI
jgi:hypothetical protein